MRHARLDYERIQDPENKIPSEEPVFLLRGQDKVGPFVCRVWALANALTGGEIRASKLVWWHAQAMKRWPKKKSCDIDDSHIPTDCQPWNG